MYNDSYECKSKGIPLVGYYKEITDVPTRYVFTQFHYHSDFEILYITGGTGEMTVGGNKFSVCKGNLILINPYEVHYGEIIGQNLSYYCLDFSMEWLFSDYCNANEKLPFYQNRICGERFERLIHNVWESYYFADADWKLKAKGNLALLFSLLHDYTVPSTEPENRFVKQVIKYLNENYQKNITSKDAANSLCYNHSYFCRMFKKYFGVPFGKYRNALRLRSACELLKNNRVSEVAAECGFSELSQFSYEFKKMWGITPLQYRKQNAKEP